jgi:hypothetical protein
VLPDYYYCESAVTCFWWSITSILGHQGFQYCGEDRDAKGEDIGKIIRAYSRGVRLREISG